MEMKNTVEIRELADRARHLAVDARMRRSTDESVLKAMEALAEAVKLLVEEIGSGRRTRARPVLP